MKKIRILALILAVLTVVCLGVLVACDDDSNSDGCAEGNHEWGKWVSNDDASCETNGTHTRKCAKCKKTETEEEPDSAYGEHIYTIYTSNNDATCTADGTKTGACLICGKEATIADEGSALGHAYSSKPLKVERGFSYYKCIRCDHVNKVDSGVIDQDFEGGEFENDSQLTVSDKVNVSIKTNGEGDALNSYLFIERSADKILGSTAFGLALTPDYSIYRNGKYVIEYKLLITDNTKDMLLLVGKKNDTEVVFAEYDSATGKIVVDGVEVYTVTKNQFMTLAFVLDDRNYVYDVYADTHMIASSVVYENKDTYYVYGELEHFMVRMVSDYMTASEFGIDDIKTYVGNAPTDVGTSFVKENTTTTVGSATISHFKPKDGCEHTYGEYVTVDATCNSFGYQIRTCSVCGGQEINTDESTIKTKTEHSFSTIKDIAATCTEDGYLSQICTICGKKTREDRTQLGHDFGDDEGTVKLEASCTESGIMIKHCTRCGEVEIEIPALGHDWAKEGEDGYNAPTCTENGSAACKRCEAVDTESYPATGHTLATEGEKYKAPTCTEAGYAGCLNCEFVDDQNYPALGHFFELKADKDEHKLYNACTREGCDNKTEVEYATELPKYADLLAAVNAAASLDVSGKDLDKAFAYEIVGKVQFKTGSNKWMVKDNGGADGVDRYVSWYGNSKGEGSTHAYINLGETAQSLALKNDFVLEMAVRLGDPDENGKYFSGTIQLLYRNNGSIAGSTNIGEVNADGSITIYGKTEEDYVTIALSDTEFTHIALAIHQGEDKVDIYVNGILIAIGNEIANISDEISEVRMFQHFAGSTVGINSWFDIANIAVYEAKMPAAILGCECDVLGAEHTESTADGYLPTTVPVSCTTDGYTERTCGICGKTYITDIVVHEGHKLTDDDGNYNNEQKKDATCTEDGYLKADCSECYETVTVEEYPSKGGHNMDVVIDYDTGKMCYKCLNEDCTLNTEVEYATKQPTYAELTAAVDKMLMEKFDLSGKVLDEEVTTTTDIGYIRLNVGSNSWVVKDNQGADGVDRYIRFNSNSIGTGSSHSYVNIGGWITGGNKYITASDHVVFEVSLRLGDAGEDGKYFGEDFQLTDRPSSGKSDYNFATMLPDGSIKFYDNDLIVALSKDNFTRISVVFDLEDKTIDIYVDGVMLAHSVSSFTGKSDDFQIKEIRMLQHTKGSTVGIGSWIDFSNVAVYEGGIPTVVCGYDKCSIDGAHTPDGEGTVTNPTCEEQGYTSYHCSVCGKDYKADFVDALGHDMVIDSENSTYNCITGGTQCKTCANGCGKTETSDVAGSGAHDWSNTAWVIETTASCSAEGHQYRLCKVCGTRNDSEGSGASAAELNQCTIAKSEHDYDESTLLREEPADGVAGYTYYKCKNCDDRKKVDDILPQTDFEFELVDGEYWITGYTGSDETVVIPSTYNGKPVVGISAGAFDDCDTVTTLIVPTSVTYIDDITSDVCTMTIKYMGSEGDVEFGGNLTSDIDSGACTIIYDYVPSEE